MKKFLKKITGFIKRHKVLTAIVIIVILAWAGLNALGKQAEAALAEMAAASTEIDTVQYRDILTSITATGNVDGVDSKNVTTTVTGLDIISINVKEGDVVKAGDVIAVLDTSDLQDDLANAQKVLANAITQNNMSISSAQQNLDNAMTNKDYAIDASGTNLNTAKDAYEDALEKYNEKVAEYSEEIAKEDEYHEYYDALKEEYESCKNYYQLLAYQVSDLTAQMNSAADDATKAELAAQLASLNSEYTKAQVAYNGFATRIAAAQSDYETAKAYRETVEKLEDAVETAQTAYENAQKAYDNTSLNQNSAITTYENSLTSAQINSNTYTLESNVRTLEDRIARATITAPIDGTITAVNFDAGDTYTGGAIVTIDNCEAFVIKANIDEYDIADIALGMKVVFKTDATRDDELEGEVTFISPTPVKSTNSTDVNYEIEITVTTPSDRLRLGMSAKLNIIVAETPNVLTIPYDAIQVDENGNDVIYIPSTETVDGKEVSSKKAIPVTVGAEGDYYVEISGDDIVEGMEVIIPQTDYVSPFAFMMEME